MASLGPMGVVRFNVLENGGVNEDFLRFTFEREGWEHLAQPVLDKRRGDCKYHKRGMCPKSCNFSRSQGGNLVVCKHWLRALCKKGTGCEFLHEYDLSKMPTCQFFTKYGECSNPECLYRHVNMEEQRMDCPYYARGFCKAGPECMYRHVKKDVCVNYLAGFCKNGKECPNGHPKFEQPAEPDDVSKRIRQPLICHNCGEQGHKVSNCPKPQPERSRAQNRPLSEVQCYKCGEMGHFANHCTSSGGGYRHDHNQQRQEGHSRPGPPRGGQQGPPPGQWAPSGPPPQNTWGGQR